MWVGGKWPSGDDAAHFPMAGRRILAARCSGGTAIDACRTGDRRDGKLPDVGQSQSLQIRYAHLARSQRVAERVSALVAIIRRIGHLADADAIKHDQQDAIESPLNHRSSPACDSMLYASATQEQRSVGRKWK